ncbi:tetratricopeptide repeat protein [bacterium]|nr:tetratricopeptide repeat protein [bacterium]MDB4689271.1 tetratricopeptide repeat protein [Verrucomicrobiota bacterium]
MNFLWSGLSVFLLVISMVITGCKPDTAVNIDEEREAYHMDAKSKLFAEEFEAAVVGFEKALEVNPNNASAHFELGLINYLHLKDYVSAIYHFQKLLEMRPNHMMAVQIKDHLERCKMDFASTVTLGPLNQNTETRLKNLVETKEELETQIKNLEGQLAQMRQVLSAQSEALNRNRQNARTESLVNDSKNPKSNAPTQTSNQGGKGKTNPTAMQNASVSTPKFRKHVIRSNDTFYKLASHYRVDFKSIQSANPGVNSIKLQIGQVVNVPYPTKTASR